MIYIIFFYGNLLKYNVQSIKQYKSIHFTYRVKISLKEDQIDPSKTIIFESQAP